MGPGAISHAPTCTLAALLLFFRARNRKRRTPADDHGAVVKISLAAPAGVDARPLAAALLASAGGFDSGSGLRLLPPALHVEEEEQPPVTSGGGGGGGEKGEGLNAGEEVKVVGRKKRKRVRKRKKKKSDDEPPAPRGEEMGEAVGVGVKESGGWEYPFTSSCSVMQRKMKLQYDQLVRSNDNKALTSAQVIQKLLNMFLFFAFVSRSLIFTS